MKTVAWEQLTIDLYPSTSDGSGFGTSEEDVDRHPNMERMRGLDLKPAVFYYCSRELLAGRPLPCKLTAEQLAYVERWSAQWPR